MLQSIAVLSVLVGLVGLVNIHPMCVCVSVCYVILKAVRTSYVLCYNVL